MFEPLKKTLLATLGIAAFTRERLERALHDLVERGELTRQQAAKLLDHLVELGAAERQGMAERVTREVERFIEHTPVVARAEFRALVDRVEALERAAGLTGRSPASSAGREGDSGS